MSGKPETLDSLLLQWINWLVPEGPQLTEIDQLENSEKLKIAFSKLLPGPLQPQEGDSLEYIHTAISCVIKLHNHGPDKFVMPPFTTDKTRNLKTITMNLFLLFMALQGEQDHFAGEEIPAWFSTLVSKYGAWDKANSSTTTEFPLAAMTTNCQSQGEEQRAEISRLKSDMQKYEEQANMKNERKRLVVMESLDDQTNELKLLEGEITRLEAEKKRREAKQMKQEEEKAENEAMAQRIEDLKNEEVSLLAAIERMKLEEKEIKEMELELTSIELTNLENRCHSQSERLRLLETQIAVFDEAGKGFDFSRREPLAEELKLLRKQIEETDPDVFYMQENKKLDDEIVSLNKRINRLRVAAHLGEFLTTYN